MTDVSLRFLCFYVFGLVDVGDYVRALTGIDY